jgi:hypothetical protein
MRTGIYCDVKNCGTGLIERDSFVLVMGYLLENVGGFGSRGDPDRMTARGKRDTSENYVELRKLCNWSHVGAGSPVNGILFRHFLLKVSDVKLRFI